MHVPKPDAAASTTHEFTPDDAADAGPPSPESDGREIQERTAVEDERVVIIRSASTPAGAAALRREAEMLERAAHPGVIRFLDLRTGESTTELRLAAAGDNSLADSAPRDLDAGLRLVAAVAATVSDLHRAGVVHGSLTPDAIVLSARSGPVIGGFARADRVGAPLLAPAVDPAFPDGTARAEALDVFGLGDLIEHVVTSVQADRTSGSRRTRQARRRSLQLAADARHADLDQRPSADDIARELARLLRERAPLQALTELRVPAAAAAVAVLAAGAAIAVPVVIASGGAADSAIEAPQPRGEATPSEPRSSATPTLGSQPRGTGLPTETIFAAGRRYGSERPGDVMATADWDCSGVDNVVLLRPTTGEVFAFADIEPNAAATGTRHRAVSAGRVEDALRFADPASPSCGELLLVTATGTAPLEVDR